MQIILSPSTYLKDTQGRLVGGPGETVTVTEEEGRALIATGSASPVEEPAQTKET